MEKIDFRQVLGLLIVFLVAKGRVCTIFPSGQDCSYPKRYRVAQHWMVGRTVSSAKLLELENYFNF